MSKIISCIAAATERLKGEPYDFTYMDLENFCKDINNSIIHIYADFQIYDTTIIGSVLYGKVIENNKLLIISEVLDDVPECYIVPGFSAYSSILQLKCMGTTLIPEETKVTKFKEISW